VRLLLFYARLRRRALDQLSAHGQKYFGCDVSFFDGGWAAVAAPHATADDAPVKLLRTRLPFVPINHNTTG
jgi:hypothetical protein